MWVLACIVLSQPKSKKGKIMGDYLEGYLAALDDVLTEIAVENPDSVNAVRYLIRHMIDDCVSE